ncbi:M57 family metalloprotease [Cellulomonas sp. CW35]|uniref:M57 family metalloprotease n=1 Tax=Cellulomonas sp. CW35 TaxID=3458249 RepID=UPI0040337949
MTIIASLAGVLMVMSPQASASNFGSEGSVGAAGTTNGVFLTRDRAWSVAKIDLTATYSNGVSAAVKNQYNPTDLTVTVYTPPGCGGSYGSYDLCVFDAEYGDNGLAAWNACAGTTSGRHPTMVCSTQYVRINRYYSPPANRIACHEMGHSIGLRHSSEASSCLKSAAEGGTSQTLTSHDKAHINGTY